MIMNGTCHLLYLNQIVISVHGVFPRCLVVPLSSEPDQKVGSPQKRLASNQFYLIQALWKHMIPTLRNRKVGKGFWNKGNFSFILLAFIQQFFVTSYKLLKLLSFNS